MCSNWASCTWRWVDFAVKLLNLACEFELLVMQKYFFHCHQSNSLRICIFESLISQLLNIKISSADRLNTVLVPVGGHVSVPCPNTSAEEVKFSLFKNTEYIYHHTRISGKNTPNHNLSTDIVGVKYDNASSFSFTLTGVNACSYGIYRCEGIVMFPPPLLQLPSDLRILLLIEGKYSSVISCIYCIFQSI